MIFIANLIDYNIPPDICKHNTGTLHCEYLVQEIYKYKKNIYIYN